MRIQFNPKDYLPDPIYRDENSGIWNFDNENTKDFEELQTGIESYQVERKETDDAEKNFENSDIIEPLAKIAPNKVSQSEEARNYFFTARI